MSTLLKILSATIILSAPALAAYAPQEMCVIPWGDSANQLKIGLPNYEDVNFTPADSNDDFIDTSGPSQGCLDRAENVYIASHSFKQLKAFDSNGRLIFDYSKGQQNYNPDLFRTELTKIYVDSISRIYVLDGMRYDYVAVADTSGNLIEKLSPHGENSGILIKNMHFNSNDILTFYLKGEGFFTVSNGNYNATGAMGWLATDGNYYSANLENTSQIRIIKYNTPNSEGISSNLNESLIPITGSSPYEIEFLGVDNEMNLYIYLIGPSPSNRRVLVYDTAYSLKEEIIFAQERNQYMWYMTPYMRPSDGNIYEFRCLDDGLYVIRWSKK